MEDAAERIINHTAERYGLLLRLNDYKLSKEGMERKVSEQECILTAKSESMKQVEGGMITKARV